MLWSITGISAVDWFGSMRRFIEKIFRIQLKTVKNKLIKTELIVKVVDFKWIDQNEPT